MGTGEDKEVLVLEELIMRANLELDRLGGGVDVSEDLPFQEQVLPVWMSRPSVAQPLLSTYDKTLVGYEDILKELEGEEADLQANTEQLRGQVDHKQAMSARAVDQMKQYKDELVGMLQEFNDGERAMDEQLAALNAEHDAVQAEHEALAGDVIALEREVRMADARHDPDEVHRLEEAVAVLERAIGATGGQRDTVRADIRQGDGMIAKYRADLELVQPTVTALQEEMSRLAASGQSTRSQLTDIAEQRVASQSQAVLADLKAAGEELTAAAVLDAQAEVRKRDAERTERLMERRLEQVARSRRVAAVRTDG